MACLAHPTQAGQQVGKVREQWQSRKDSETIRGGDQNQNPSLHTMSASSPLSWQPLGTCDQGHRRKPPRGLADHGHLSR